MADLEAADSVATEYPVRVRPDWELDVFLDREHQRPEELRSAADVVLASQARVREYAEVPGRNARGDSVGDCWAPKENRAQSMAIGKVITNRAVIRTCADDPRREASRSARTARHGGPVALGM